MALTRINGNNIQQSTAAIITSLKFLNSSGNAVLTLPVGTTAQRPAGPDEGTVRYNTDVLAAEIYTRPAVGQALDWFPLSGGGPSLGDKSVIRTNSNVIDENITIGATGTKTGIQYSNGMSAGPITIASGRTITIQSGASWSIR